MFFHFSTELLVDNYEKFVIYQFLDLRVRSGEAMIIGPAISDARWEGIALYNGLKTSARPKNFLPSRKFLDPVKPSPNPEIFLCLRSKRAQLDADPSDNVSQRALPSR